MSTSPSPEELRANIERTRSALSSDVNALTEEVKPSAVARRQVDKVRGGLTGSRIG